MDDFQIGTEFADGKFYAGPNYGFVEKQKYQDLLKDGSLGRGEQNCTKTYFKSSAHTFGRIIDFLQTLEKNGKGGQKNKRQNV